MLAGAGTFASVANLFWRFLGLDYWYSRSERALLVLGVRDPILGS